MRQTILAVALLLLCPVLVGAKPPYKQALVDLFCDALPEKLRDCRTYHQPGQDEDRPHNAAPPRFARKRTHRLPV